MARAAPACSRFRFAANRWTRDGGCRASVGAPSNLFSSAVSAANKTGRTGRGSVASASATASIRAVPSALSTRRCKWLAPHRRTDPEVIEMGGMTTAALASRIRNRAASRVLGAGVVAHLRLRAERNFEAQIEGLGLAGVRRRRTPAPTVRVSA